MRTSIRAAAAFALASAAAVAAAQSDSHDAVFARLEILAHLDNSGAVHVAEDQTVDMLPSVTELSRDFGIGAGQRVVLTGLFRIDEKGQRRALTPAEEPKPDQYALYPTWIKWIVPPASGTAVLTRRYRLEYELVNAVAPAWDLPNGDSALDGLHDSFWKPQERAQRIVPVWREAWPNPGRLYRLDHDVLFPGRDNRSLGLGELHYQLSYDDAWKLVDPQRDIGVATMHSDYRVRRTLEYLPAGRPAAVDVKASALRMAGLLFLVPVAGTLLWLFSLAIRRLAALGRAPADAALFESAAMSEPPELSAQRLSGDAGPVSFEDFIVRLAGERRVSIEVPERKSEDEVLETRLRLLGERDELHPYEREVIDKLFGSAREVTPSELRGRPESIDGDEVVAAAFARARPPRPRTAALGKLVGVLLFVGGAALCVSSLVFQHAELPFALFTGIGSGMLLTAIPLWLPLRILLVLALGLIPNVPMHPAAVWGVSLLVLSSYAARRLSWVSRRDEAGQRYDDLQRAYVWAVGELRKPRPALRDAWIPYLRAYGLGPQIEAWRKRYGGAAAPTGAPDLSELGSQPATLGPPFTGVAPERPFPADDDWAAGFLS